MYRVFNCGVGMVLIVNEMDCDKVIDILKTNQIQAWQMGEIIERQDMDTEQVIFV